MLEMPMAKVVMAMEQGFGFGEGGDLRPKAFQSNICECT